MITYQITIDHTKISTNLINFPVMLVLSHMPDVTYPSKVQVTAGGIECYVEISAGCLWVKVPNISSTSDTVLYLQYNPTWPDNTAYVGVTGTVPAQNVWDANYTMVLHLVEQGNGTPGEYQDSTSHHNNGTAFNAPIQVLDELGLPVQLCAGNGITLASCIKVPGPSDYSLSIPIPGGFTVEIALSPNQTDFTTNWGDSTSEHYVPIINKADSDGPGKEWSHTVYDNTGSAGGRYNWCNFYVDDPDEEYGAGSFTTGVIPLNSWVCLAGIANCTSATEGTNQEFRNGVPYQTSIADWASGNGSEGYPITYVPSMAPIKIGCWDPNNDDMWFPGRIKEVRISNISRSQAWMLATYAAEFDNLVSFEELSNIFVHGNQYTASFAITELPTGKPCQVQIQVGTVLSNKVSFTSGTNVPVSVPITMPSAGTYRVYIDVYMEGVLIQTGTDPNQVTVV